MEQGKNYSSNSAKNFVFELDKIGISEIFSEIESIEKTIDKLLISQ